MKTVKIMLRRRGGGNHTGKSFEQHSHPNGGLCYWSSMLRSQNHSSACFTRRSLVLRKPLPFLEREHCCIGLAQTCLIYAERAKTRLQKSTSTLADTLFRISKMLNGLEKSPTSSARQHESTSTSTPLYIHTFFSPDAVAACKQIIPSYVLPVIYNAILLWACVALFFGSLLKNNDISRISVTAVNLDDGSFGAGLIDGIKSSLMTPGPNFR